MCSWALLAVVHGWSIGWFADWIILLFAIAGFAAATSVRKNGKTKPKEAEAIKKISSMVNRSSELSAILISALDEIMALLGMDAGIFRLRATSEASSKTVFHGFSKETALVLEEMNDENTEISSNISDWGPGELADSLKKDGLKSLLNRSRNSSPHFPKSSESRQ
jgi:2-methylisocitrate lyase-like PEP mutase family enzyme